jgi:hypothetical protein
MNNKFCNNSLRRLIAGLSQLIFDKQNVIYNSNYYSIKFNKKSLLQEKGKKERERERNNV